MIKGFWINSFWNSFNKLFTLLRVQTQVLLMGDSALADMFFLSNKIIAIVRRCFVDGSFESIFTSYYLQSKEKGNFTLSVLRKFVFLTTLLALGSIVISCFFSVGKKVHLLGFTSISCWIIVFMFCNSLFTGILNAEGQFSRAAPAATVGNLLNICFILFFSFIWKNVFLGFALGNLMYSLGQTIYLYLFARKYIGKEILALPEDFTKDIKSNSIANMIAPLAEFFVTRIYFLIPGVLSYMEYSHKIIYFLFSVLGIPLSSGILPSLNAGTVTAEECFLLAHTLALPPMFFFNSTACAKLIFGSPRNIKDLLLFSKILSIVSVSLYFYITVRILNTIAISRKKIKNTSKGSLIYAAGEVIFSLLAKNAVQLAWAANCAVISQWLFLIYNASFSFNFKQVGSLFLALFTALPLIKFSPLMCNYFLEKQFGLFLCAGSFFVYYLIYILINWHSVKLLFFSKK